MRRPGLRKVIVQRRIRVVRPIARVRRIRGCGRRLVRRPRRISGSQRIAGRRISSSAIRRGRVRPGRVRRGRVRRSGLMLRRVRIRRRGLVRRTFVNAAAVHRGIAVDRAIAVDGGTPVDGATAYRRWPGGTRNGLLPRRRRCADRRYRRSRSGRYVRRIHAFRVLHSGEPTQTLRQMPAADIGLRRRTRAFQ